MSVPRIFDAGLLFTFISIGFSLHVPSQVEQPPTITAESVESVVALPVAHNFTLTCEATGNPKPVFNWTKNGLNFNPHNDPRLTNFENSGSFVIPNNKYPAEYQGKYRCYASNKLGVAMSKETHFIVPALPRFPKHHIPPTVVKVGDPVVLECNPPEGILPRNLYWMNIGLQHIEQDDRVSMGLNGNLYFSNVLEKDNRSDYCCYASFPRIYTMVQKNPMAIVVMSSTSSGETDVTISVRKPNLLVPTGDLSQAFLVQGQDLEIECIAEGLPTPIIEWSKTEGKLPQRTTIENYGKLLIITNVTGDDNGKYMCKAKNSAGESTHLFDIAIEEPPRWVQEPTKNKVAAIGSNIIIRCLASGKPLPTITWMRNGKPLQKFRSSNIIVRGNRLIFYKANQKNSAVYQCEASNKHGTLLSNTNILVMNLPPLILTQNSVNYGAVCGKSVIMDCKAFSYPSSVIHWRKEGLEGPVVGERFFVHKNGSLQIHTTEMEDTGKYICFVNNSEGNSSIIANLHIKEPIKIVTPPQEMKIKRGSMAKLLCKAWYDQSLTDALKILWQKDGKEIYSNHDEDSRFYIDEGTLQINNVSHSDRGLYTCIARTSFYEDTASAYVTVLDVPDPPVDLTLSDLRDCSVKLHWVPTKDYNSSITEYIIEFEENDWEPGNWRPLLRVSGHNNSAPLSLYGHINYQFRVSAVNAIGRGHPSSPSERYKTPPAAPDRNPESIKIEGHSPHQMNITWEPLMPIEYNGPGLVYKISYRQMGVEEIWTETIVTRNSFVVKGIQTFVPYEVKIQAHNNHGSAVEPSVVIGYSGEDLPAAAPENVHVEVLNSTLVQVSWSPVQKAQLRGLLQGYNLHCWRTQSLLTSTEVPAEKQFLTLTGNQSHTIVSGLKPFSQYRLKVNAFNRKGSGPSSSPVTFTTPQGVPERPPVLRATNPQGTAGVHDRISSTSWFIGITCAVALLTLVALIACFVTKNKSGIYAVKEKEDMQLHLDFKGMNNETSFEYSCLEGNQPTLVGEIKEDSNLGSSADYENEVCEFCEDGSFIGEYIGSKQM